MYPFISVQQILNATYDSAANKQVTVPAFNFLNITTSAQNIIKTSAGILGGVHVGVGTLTSAVRLYDNTVSGGTVIATIAAGASGGFYPLAARFNNGLVVSSGAAADNITAFYL